MNFAGLKLSHPLTRLRLRDLHGTRISKKSTGVAFQSHAREPAAARKMSSASGICRGTCGASRRCWSNNERDASVLLSALLCRALGRRVTR